MPVLSFGLLFFFQAEDGIRDPLCDWSSDVCSSDLCSGISGVAAGGFKLTVTSSGTSAGNDFGNYTTGSVSGVKFEDHNANGVKNVGDQGLANWTRSEEHTSALQSHSDLVCRLLLETYSFDLQPGDYLVCEVLKSLYTQSAPSGTDCSGISGVAAGGFKLTVTFSGTVADHDLHSFPTRRSSDLKFEDHNANGVKNVGDQGLANWT